MQEKCLSFNTTENDFFQFLDPHNDPRHICVKGPTSSRNFTKIDSMEKDGIKTGGLWTVIYCTGVTRNKSKKLRIWTCKQTDPHTIADTTHSCTVRFTAWSPVVQQPLSQMASPANATPRGLTWLFVTGAV